MILIVGGTGRLGSSLANRMAERGAPVRVLSRGLVTPTTTLDPRVERVVADVRDPSRLQEFVADAQVVVLAMQGFAGPGRVSPRTVDLQGGHNVIAAAQRSNTEVVMLSIAGASPTSPLELAQVKYVVEQDLRASGCPWTVVRADAFAQTWFGVLEQTAGKVHRPVVFGNGDNPIGWVDVNEVAALVERAVLDTGLRGRTFEISGPERLTLMQLALLLMKHRGWPGEPRRLPRSALRMLATLAAPIRPEIARQARASLAMDVLPPIDDAETRAAFPDLPSVPVSQLLSPSI